MYRLVKIRINSNNYMTSVCLSALKTCIWMINRI